MLWAIALSRSFALRPTLVGEREILVRFGLLFSLRIPVEKVRAISRTPVSGAVMVPRNTTGTLFLEFTEPLEAHKLSGFTSRISVLALSADEDQAFEAGLREVVPAVCSVGEE